jgi:integrase
MTKKRLTDRTLKALKTTGERYDVMDTDVPSFGVRVTERGRRTFILIARYPGSTNPTRRSVGEYPALSLENARTRARHWRDLIRQGIDPKAEEECLRRLELRKQQTTFAAVAEDFLERHIKGQRKAKDSKREIRKELIAHWGERPIASITREDVVVLVDAIARRAPYLAHNVLAHVRSMFNWAINRGTYGLETSPCDRLKPSALIGAKQPRQRILNNDELKALWQVSEIIGYPFGPMYRLLLLTGARKSEIAGGQWRELDLQKKLWMVPPERFKSNATHIIPLSDQAVAVLRELPRFTKGDHLFTTTFGVKHVTGFSRAKTLVDKLLAERLEVSPPPWVIHDIRRTVRTRLASLRVPDMVAEMIIGHGRKGLQRVYDQHRYVDEMREALELWATRLRDIVTPPPENVVRMRERV